jgi:uncharacterized membrane protein required for colicin V production
MNYLDLLLTAIIVWYVYKGVSKGGQRALVSLLRSLLAFALAMLAKPRLLAWPPLRTLSAQLEQSFAGSVTLPAGPGTPWEGALRWLKEADLPEVIARGIREAWRTQDPADAALLMESAGRVLAAAAVNALCFAALFLVARFLIDYLSRLVVKALPPDTFGKSRGAGFCLSVIESILISALLIALLAPFALALGASALMEHYRGSIVVGYLGPAVQFIAERLYFMW